MATPAAAGNPILTPGLSIIHSNHLEDLRRVAVQWIASHPLAPLENEVFIVHSNGMAQWLKLALAENDGCGISAALGNVEEDKPEWHAFDTVKGGDYLVDQQAANILAEEAVQAVYDLENRGLPFNRTPEGRIDQRRFGGHTSNFGEKPVRRACHSADRTGHMILQTLYQQCIKNNVHFYDEFHVVDMIMNGDVCVGVIAIQLGTGEMHVFHAKATLFATGGWGRVWNFTSNAHSLTGDGAEILMRRGVPLQDMEFFQFHPTGIYKMGILITEGVRGEGGVLINNDGERFMDRYAPTVKDLASRDVVSRAMAIEVLPAQGPRCTSGWYSFQFHPVLPGPRNAPCGRPAADSPDACNQS